MTYVCSGAEDIPFSDGHFDVVTSLNSLDHVDDVTAAVREIARVVRPGGMFLLEVEVGHDPTPTEPISIWFDILDELRQWFDVVTESRFEMPADHFVHAAWWKAVPFDEAAGRHAGVLVARLTRR
jgi:ubiquinone/menaquinone biosynthesis C-methylase UbiE